MVQPSNTHPFKIPVDHPLTVHIDKAPATSANYGNHVIVNGR
jgi:hypothetical protein